MSTREKTLLFHNDTPGFQVVSIALSPDKEFVAFGFAMYDPQSQTVVQSAGLNIMRTSGSDLRTLVQLDMGDWLAALPRWSPTGSRIAYLRESVFPGGSPQEVNLYSVDVATGRDQLVSTDAGWFDWSPDGSQVIFEGQDGHGLYVVDVDSARRRTLWEDTVLSFGMPAWRPVSQSVAVGLGDWEEPFLSNPSTGLFLIDTATLERAKVSDKPALQPSWSLDGQRLIFGVPTEFDRRELWIVDLALGTQRNLLSRVALLGTPAWSAGGEGVLVVAEEERARSYWVSVLDAKTGSLTRLVLVRTLNPDTTW